MGPVPRRGPDPRGPQREQRPARRDRRGPARLRPGGRRPSRLRRLRAEELDQRGDPRPEELPIRTVADLKGKKVAVTKGSNANYFLAKALEGAGLKYSDITPVYLIPGDGLAALGSGAVDAYSVWEPYQTVATRSHDARELLNGEKTIANYEYFLARRDFAETSPKILAILKEETNKADAWALQNPRAVAELLAPELKVDADTLEVVAKKQARGLQDPDDTVLAYQQSLADTFLSIGLISKPIAVKDAFLGKTATTAAK